jgi:hypothetical protein
MADEPNAVNIEIGCPCHYSDLGCRGALQITLPLRVFDTGGELEYRLLLQKFVGDSVRIFDQFYERVRADLANKNPLALYPARVGRLTALVSSDTLQSLAGEGNGKDEMEDPAGN